MAYNIISLCAVITFKLRVRYREYDLFVFFFLFYNYNFNNVYQYMQISHIYFTNILLMKHNIVYYYIRAINGEALIILCLIFSIYRIITKKFVIC